MDVRNRVIEEYRRLADETREMEFHPPVSWVYRPLDYARGAHEAYISRFLIRRPRVVFLGMNPGPFGMTQTGVPFGEVSIVKDWLGIRDGIVPPAQVHPKKPIDGFSCRRSEVSGRRLWGLFRQRFPDPLEFFAGHFVLNYCPMLFLAETGANLTPVQLTAFDQHRLKELCDPSLRRLLELMEPEFLVGIGKYAEERGREVLAGTGIRVSAVLHPSPANPRANRDWAGEAENTLIHLGIWRRPNEAK